jgi:dienelactone hydrolase
VIVLHDCGGLKASSNTWMATWLPFVRELGYAIFRPDSFTARGQTDTCDKQSLFEQQARDVFASALVLAGRPEVRRDRIAVLGHSHSGAAIIRYVVRDRPEFRPLRAGLAQRGANVVAAVAISPNCDPEIAYPVIIPTLLLTGALDDWTPASTCYDLIRDPASAAKLRAKVYPGAYHGFDVLGPPRTRLGHRIEYNKEATDDARTEARALLARLLQ